MKTPHAHFEGLLNCVLQKKSNDLAGKSLLQEPAVEMSVTVAVHVSSR